MSTVVTTSHPVGWETARVRYKPYKSDYTVYALQDPRDESIRYIGLTTNPEARLIWHLRVDSPKEQNAAKNAWVKELLDQGLRPKMLFLKQGKWLLKTAKRWERLAIIEWSTSAKLFNILDNPNPPYPITTERQAAHPMPKVSREAQTKAISLTVSVPADIFNALDKHCLEGDLSFSDWFVDRAKEFFERYPQASFLGAAKTIEQGAETPCSPATIRLS